MCKKKSFHTLAVPGGGAAPGAHPPNGRGPMIFFCPKRYFFSILIPPPLRSIKSGILHCISPATGWALNGPRKIIGFFFNRHPAAPMHDL